MLLIICKHQPDDTSVQNVHWNLILQGQTQPLKECKSLKIIFVAILLSPIQFYRKAIFTTQPTPNTAEAGGVIQHTELPRYQDLSDDLSVCTSVCQSVGLPATYVYITLGAADVLRWFIYNTESSLCNVRLK